jgi:hypothetical protein
MTTALATIAVLLSAAALFVSIWTALIGRRNVIAAEDSAVSARFSAEAAKDSAKHAEKSAESAGVVAQAEVGRAARFHRSDARTALPEGRAAQPLDDVLVRSQIAGVHQRLRSEGGPASKPMTLSMGPRRYLAAASVPSRNDYTEAIGDHLPWCPEFCSHSRSGPLRTRRCCWRGTWLQRYSPTGIRCARSIRCRWPAIGNGTPPPARSPTPATHRTDVTHRGTGLRCRCRGRREAWGTPPGHRAARPCGLGLADGEDVSSQDIRAAEGLHVVRMTGMTPLLASFSISARFDGGYVVVDEDELTRRGRRGRQTRPRLGFGEHLMT